MEDRTEAVNSSSLRYAVVLFRRIIASIRPSSLINDNHDNMVSVASDAGGLGFNLKIKRVVFTID
jgi:hypothetical protein